MKLSYVVLAATLFLALFFVFAAEGKPKANNENNKIKIIVNYYSSHSDAVAADGGESESERENEIRKEQAAEEEEEEQVLIIEKNIVQGRKRRKGISRRVLGDISSSSSSAGGGGGAMNATTGFVINTWGFSRATDKAWERLLAQDSALTAVEMGCTECEVLQCDTTVGYGGSPDEHGETTLDALIMDGNTHSIGAVGCLRRIKPAISVARAVMEHTKHSILVGELATEFARQMGFTEESLTTPVSAEMHESWKNNSCQPNFWKNVTPDPTRFCGPYSPVKKGVAAAAGAGAKVREGARKIDQFNHDTIGMVVIDANGAIASGASSNGARNKVPGRVGDAAIVGAGTYVDRDVGGAAATGDGDVMMRFLPSLLAVEKMRAGNTPMEAAEFSILKIARFYPNFSGAIVTMNLRGEYGAACYGIQTFPFSYRNATLDNSEVYSVPCVTLK